MKFILSLLVGIAFGAVLFAVGLYYNPLLRTEGVSPLALTNERTINLSFSAVPDDAVLYTDNGGSIVEPRPARVQELWEPAVEKTRVLVTEMLDVRGQTVGLGIKISSPSENTSLINGEALVDSIWHVYLPDEGSFLIDQTENYWSYIRNIVIPARRSSAKNWRGALYAIMTNGPTALGTANVTGGSGSFEGVSSESVESLTALAYSAKTGPVAMEGGLSIIAPQLQGGEQTVAEE